MNKSDADANVKQLADFRRYLIELRTGEVNRIKSILDKNNLFHDAPTQDYTVKEFREWIKVVSLPRVDRFIIANCNGDFRTG